MSAKTYVSVRRGMKEEAGAYLFPTTFIAVVESVGTCYLYLFE